MRLWRVEISFWVRGKVWGWWEVLVVCVEGGVREESFWRDF